MKFPSVHRKVSLVVAACLLLPGVGASQHKLADPDKSQIIQYILRTYDFTQSKGWCPNGDNLIYLSSENISPADIPHRRPVTFEIIDQSEINRLMGTGVEYYEFTDFEIQRSRVRLLFARTFISADAANDGAVEYTCRKVAGRWKLAARLQGGGAS